MLTTPTLSLGTVCCFGSDRFNRLERAGAGYTGKAQIPTYPGGGNINGFTWGHRLANYGTQDNDVALLMSDGLYITGDIQATPIVWTELPDVPGIGNACSVETSMEGATPVFFVQIGQCTGRGDDQLYRYEDTVNDEHVGPHRRQRHAVERHRHLRRRSQQRRPPLRLGHRRSATSG